MYKWVLIEARRVWDSLELELKVVVGARNLNSGSLEQQQMLLTAFSNSHMKSIINVLSN